MSGASDDAPLFLLVRRWGDRNPSGMLAAPPARRWQPRMLESQKKRRRSDSRVSPEAPKSIPCLVSAWQFRQSVYYIWIFMH